MKTRYALGPTLGKVQVVRMVAVAAAGGRTDVPVMAVLSEVFFDRPTATMAARVAVAVSEYDPATQNGPVAVHAIFAPKGTLLPVDPDGTHKTAPEFVALAVPKARFAIVVDAPAEPTAKVPGLHCELVVTGLDEGEYFGQVIVEYLDPE